MVKVKRTYSLEEYTVETIERLAQSTRRDLSAIVDLAVKVYANEFCPQCDAPTVPHPDPGMVGVRFCVACRESVGIDDGRDGRQR